MKCKNCGHSYAYLDESCNWFARRNVLGTACGIGMCDGDMDCSGDCIEREAPKWDCDLGQNNRYCINHIG